MHALCDEGLATSAQPTGTKTTMARLTDDGDVTARQLCGLPSRWGGWLSLVKAGSLTKRRGKPRYLDDIWIAEVRFDGLKNWKHPKGQEALNGSLILTEEMHLPALVRGWLSSLTTLGRHCYYLVTDAGWALLEAGKAPPEEEVADGDTEARDLYYREMKGRLVHLATAKPEDTKEIGGIPLPVAIHTAY